MRNAFILLVLLIFAAPAYSTTVYKWVDKEGVVNFTDDYNNVPFSYRDRVEVERYRSQVEAKHFLTEGLAPAYTEVATQKKAEVKANLHDRDYWKQQLDEATANYEKGREELLKEGEKLVWFRYGGKTQYQMFTAGLPGISERLDAYRDQMIEAKEMLETFKNETQGRENARTTFSPKTDIYGRDETWWKEKVRPWEEQLEEATQNYEKASDAIVKQLEGLGPFRWGGLSLTQYQMISSRLTDLYARMAKYQTEISETKRMLAKLSKEAKETKADPSWFK
jgi:chromosome segregation ATPase